MVQATRVHFVLLIISIILISTPTYAQWGNTSTEVLTDDGLYKYGSLQAMDLDSSGNPHLAWLQMTEDYGYKILYTSQDSEGEWGSFQTAADTSMHPSEPAIAISPYDDSPYIVYTSDDQVYISYLSGTVWADEQVSQDYSSNYYPTIAIDDDGYISIAWIIWDDNLQEYHIAYARGNIGFWNEMMLEDSYLGDFGEGASPYIDVASDGVAHIVYRGGDYGGYHAHHAWNNERGGDQWEYETIYTSNANDYNVMLEIDSQDGLHLAMGGSDSWGFSTRSAYKYKSPDGIWGESETISTLSITAPTLSLDIYNNPYISAEGVSGNFYTGVIYIAYKDDSEIWQCDSLYGNDHFYPCVKIDQYNVGKMFCSTGGNTGVYDIYYLTGDIATSIGDDHNYDRTARSYELMQNYPNPFNDETIISFSLSQPGQVQLNVYNTLGEKVTSIYDGYKEAGIHEFLWNTSGISSGMYFYQLKYDGATINRKATLLK